MLVPDPSSTVLPPPPPVDEDYIDRAFAALGAG